MIAAIPEVLNGLHPHIFNGAVYPDFFRLPDPASRCLWRISLDRDGKSVGRAGCHTDSSQPCCADGRISSPRGEETVLYSGDTYRTEALWQAAKRDGVEGGVH